MRRVRAVVAVATVSLVLTACGSGTADPEAEPSRATPPSPTSADSSASSSDTSSDAGTPALPESEGGAEQIALGPEYAVEAPGPREAALVPADLLIQDSEKLPAETVRELRNLKGVRLAVPLSLAQVDLENRVYTVAAVDPGRYRRFTERVSADLQRQWERVAAGEVAVDDELKKKLPVDDDGFVKLEIDDSSRRVHVGAWAPQVEGIDMVVNEKVGEALGMVPGNALIISTGLTSPQSMRKPVERVIGGTSSVQALDVVAREGLDPDAFQNVVLVGSKAEAVDVFRYTPIGGGRVRPDPAWVASHIDTQTVPILGSVTCNKAIFPQLKAALREIQTKGLADEIYPDQYAGCYYPRFIAGTTTLSNHSFGLALDLNVPGNMRGTVGKIDRGVVAAFKKWGFAWGGDWSYTDPMHFELDRIVRPG